MARLAVILPGDRGPHFTFHAGRRALAVFGEGSFAVNLPIVLQVGYVSSGQGSDGAGTPKEQRICTTGTAGGNSYFLTI
jgi:hypothetical protein